MATVQNIKNSLDQKIMAIKSGMKMVMNLGEQWQRSELSIYL